MTKYHIDFEPVGRRGRGPADQSLLEAARQLGVELISLCGGKGTCSRCKIQIIDGEVSPPTPNEEQTLSPQELEGHPAITITQQDVRELQLAKGAMRAGIQLLLEAMGRTDEELEKVIITGAFGSYIDVASAVSSGMLPPLPLNRFRQVGNAAGMGAKLALISRAKRAEAQTIAHQDRYIELTNAPRFTETFAQATCLG